MDDDICPICPICQESYSEGGNITELEDCNHKFHTQCIITWFRSPNSQGTCPCCRNTSSHIYNRMGVYERATWLTRKSRAKSAPKELKKLAQKLKLSQQRQKDNEKLRKEWIKKPEVKEVFKKDRELWRKKCRDRSRTRKNKVLLGLYEGDSCYRSPFVRISREARNT